MLTVTATLLCIDNLTGKLFDSRTYPISCGPGKADHNVVFREIIKSIQLLSQEQPLLYFQHHRAWTSIRCHIIALLMDQPERRSSTNLLEGNSKQRAIFGLSCQFDQLEGNFAACPKCVCAVQRYMIVGTYLKPVVFACRQCYSFLLTRLLLYGKYKTLLVEHLPRTVPGFIYSVKPSILSFEVLLAGWDHAIQKFVFINPGQKSK